ncbi:ASCH domain-containing protein [Loktanella sp. DJP18]|uniref:ASCH domain-containing protein n=1 Tax=Loktanella sp. DJP18 TaxID=3409788 RepID=UPI003BB5280E
MTDLLADLRQRHPDAVTFTLGDSAALCAQLLSLVISGAKTATCGALRDFDAGEPLPEPGRRDIALHWDGTPACVIETQQVVTGRFEDVTAAMALAEGENDDLAGWRDDHSRYFARNGGFAPDMMVVWERFALIEVC